MLRQIDPITCKQYVSANSPAIVLTVVKLCFSPPFKYVVISHSDSEVVAISMPIEKEEIEFKFNIEL